MIRCVLATLAVLAALGFANGGSAQSAQPSMRELARQVAIDFTTRATSAERDGQPMAAEAYYARALDADPGYLPPHLGFARLVASRGRTGEALHVLAQIPARALLTDRDVVDVARMSASLGDIDGALDMLGNRAESAEASRARADLAAAAGRFPEALLSARRFLELTRGTDRERDAGLLVRALGILVGDADAVRAPGEGAGVVRRLLAM